MDLLYAMRDLGLTDSAESASDGIAHAALAREIDAAVVAKRAGGSNERRRVRARFGVRVGLPAVLTAGIAIVLVATSGGLRGPALPSVRITGPSAHAPGAVLDSAYIVRRVRTRLAVADHGRGLVLSTLDTSSYPIYRTVTYYDPKTHIFYQDALAYDRHGHELFANVDADIPIDGYMHFRTFTIDYRDHTWNEGESAASGPLPNSAIHLKHPLPPSATSSSLVIERALASHLATRAGTATVNGSPVLVLKGRAGQDQITLYVNARTYQPLRETEHAQTRFPVDRVTDVLPATAANIARAKNPPPIPSGYTRGN